MYATTPTPNKGSYTQYTIRTTTSAGIKNEYKPNVHYHIVYCIIHSHEQIWQHRSNRVVTLYSMAYPYGTGGDVTLKTHVGTITTVTECMIVLEC
jgi:hypothetical protein